MQLDGECHFLLQSIHRAGAEACQGASYGGPYSRLGIWLKHNQGPTTRVQAGAKLESQGVTNEAPKRRLISPASSLHLHLSYRVTSTRYTVNYEFCLLRHILFVMKGSFALSLLPLLASASPVLIDTIHNEAAPVLSSTQATEIPDSYIIVFKESVTHSSAALHHDWVQNQHIEIESSKRDLEKRSQSQFPITAFSGLRHTYNIGGGLLGYSGHFDESVIERVRRHPDVSKHCPNSYLPILPHVITTKAGRIGRIYRKGL
jgi:hypothetical protein